MGEKQSEAMRTKDHTDPSAKHPQFSSLPLLKQSPFHPIETPPFGRSVGRSFVHRGPGRARVAVASVACSSRPLPSAAFTATTTPRRLMSRGDSLLLLLLPLLLKSRPSLCTSIICVSSSTLHPPTTTGYYGNCSSSPMAGWLCVAHTPSI